MFAGGAQHRAQRLQQIGVQVEVEAADDVRDERADDVRQERDDEEDEEDDAEGVEGGEGRSDHARGPQPGPRLAPLAHAQQNLPPAARERPRDRAVGLARVLGRSGDRQSIPELQKLSNDPDTDVAQEGLKALRSLQARM